MTNGIVLDPFLGSGSTLIACCEKDRVCRGIELDPKFVDVIVKRYLAWCHEKQTAEVAYVIRDGQKLTYEEAIAAMPQGGDAAAQPLNRMPSSIANNNFFIMLQR